MDELNSELLAQVEYDVTSDEENTSFKAYQKIYTTKKNIIQTCMFIILAILLLIRALKNPDYTLLWGAMGVAVAFAAYIWINPIVTRKNLIKALKKIEGDKYCFDLYNEYFSIKTIQIVNNTVTPDIEDTESEIDISEIPPKIVKFEEEKVDFVEKNDVFIIFLEKQTYYTLPKRCMDMKTQETIRSFFKKINK